MRAFCQKHNFWTFWLVMGQISSNLLKKAFATWQHNFLSTSVVFYDIFAQACAAKVTYVFRLFGFFNIYFFYLSFFSFCYLFAAVIDLLLGFKNFQENIIETGNFCHGVATCSTGTKFWVFHSNFSAFLCIVQAPLCWSLWSGHHWGIFSSCISWVQVMPILLKGDDVRSGKKAKACHKWL